MNDDATPHQSVVTRRGNGWKTFRVSWFGVMKAVEMLQEKQHKGVFASHSGALNKSRMGKHRRGTIVLSQWAIDRQDDVGYYVDLKFERPGRMMISRDRTGKKLYADHKKLLRCLHATSV